MTEPAISIDAPWTSLPARALDEQHRVHLTRLPSAVDLDFRALWAIHPDRFHRVSIMGRETPVPRWSRAYGADYHYSGRTDRAEPVPPLLAGTLAWARETIEPRLNGLLLNWYDGEQRHYIGKHRDSTKSMVAGTPIVTISLGASRPFRLRPWRVAGADFIDVEVGDRSVLVIPWETNLSWTHEVPHRAEGGRRISITLRAFAESESASIL